ncbi:hypothetical protein [Mesorhizobium japonicum]|uniref:hypothetical protein n=1 Tax=Mesorhizobium japonicum TaxID=2066070 RepID=UPI003B5989C7
MTGLSVDLGVEGSGDPFVPRNFPDTFATAGWCGHSFDQGVLRFHDAETAAHYREYIEDAFPDIAQADPEFDLLAYDWAGRQYVTVRPKAHLGRIRVADVHLASLATGEWSPFLGAAEFTQAVSHERAREFFEANEFDAWRVSVGAPGLGLAFDECVDYAVPFYLGGEKTIENMRLTDLDVSWSIGSQIRAQTRHLKPGDPVPRFRIE